MLRRKCRHDEIIQRIYMLRRGAFVETEQGIGLVVNAYNQIKNTATVYFGDSSIQEISPCDILITSIEAKINSQAVELYGEITEEYEEIALREDLAADKLEVIPKFIDAHSRTIHVSALTGIHVIVGTISLNEKIFRDNYDDLYDVHYGDSISSTCSVTFTNAYRPEYLFGTSDAAVYHDFSSIRAGIYSAWNVRDFTMIGYNLQTNQARVLRDKTLSYPIEEVIKDKLLLRGTQCRMIRRMNSEER